jgi:hypothetical protein
VPAAPFLVGIAPIVALWAANRAEFPATVLVPLSIVVGGIAAGALLVGRGLTGRWAAGAVVAAVILAIVVGHGLQLDLVAAVTTPRQAERAAGIIAAASIVLALGLVIVLAWLARTRRLDGADAARALAVGAIAFMALALASPPDPDANAGGGGEGGAVLHDADPTETPAPPVAVGRPAQGTLLPDVYYVILDGYTRGDVLDEVYQFDNEPFLSALEARGFVVARESYSNYPATYLSLASSLNERYVTQELVAGRVQGDYRELIQNGAVPAAFKALGYRFVLIRSVWEGTARSPLADEVLGQGSAFGSEFAAGVVERSVFGGLLPQASVADSHLAAFGALDNLPDAAGPTFTFAHIIVPHPPYVLDRNGTIISNSAALRGSWAGAENMKGYLEQLRFANDRFMDALDGILAKSSVPPIVIVQGDHGVFGASFDVDDDRRATAARLAILNAYLVPNEMRHYLYPSISPVNSFRVILPALLGQPPELLEDRFFYYEDERPGPFVEVSPDFDP